MSHTSSKARIRDRVLNSPRSCVRPRCKIEPYGLARKNCLVGIANRLSYQTYEVRSDKNTTWVTTDTDVIGVETRYVEELGMDVKNFFKPQFNKNYSSTQPVRVKAIQLDPVMEIKRRSQEDRESSTLRADDIVNVLVPFTSPAQPIRKISSKGVISDKLMSLMDSENVQKIDHSEIKGKGTLRQFSTMRHNKVVKMDKRSTSIQKSRKISPQLALRASNRPMPKKPKKSECSKVIVTKETFSKTKLVKETPKENTIATNIDKKEPDNLRKCEKSSQTTTRNIKSIANREAISMINLKYPKTEVSRNTSKTKYLKETVSADRGSFTGKKRQSAEKRNQKIVKKAQEEYDLQSESSSETNLKLTQNPNTQVHKSTGPSVNLTRWKDTVRKQGKTKKIKNLRYIRERHVKDNALIDAIYVIFLYLVYVTTRKRLKKQDRSLKIVYLVYNEKYIMETSKILPNPQVANRLEFNLEELLAKSKKSLMVETHNENTYGWKKDMALVFLVFVHMFTLILLFSNTFAMWFQQIYNIIDYNQLKRFFLSLTIW